MAEDYRQHEEKMSLMKLNNDCLIKIMSSIYNAASFYNFSLTCKRFYSVVTRASQDWHDEIKARKITFYALKFMTKEYFLLYTHPHKREDNWPDLVDLTKYHDLYNSTKPTVANVHKVWRSLGPVAAEIFTWIKDADNFYRLADELDIDSYDEICCFRKKVCFYFPPMDGEALFSLSLYPGHRIRIYTTYSDVFPEVLEIENEYCQDVTDVYRALKDEEIFSIFNLSTESGTLMDAIREALGPTNRPITSKDLIWILFLPESLEFEVSSEKSPLFFKDSARNKEPTLESLKPALRRWNKVDSLIKLKKKSKYIPKILEVLRHSNVSPNSFVDKLSHRLYSYLNFADIPEELLMWLLLRTKLYISSYGIKNSPITEIRRLELRINQRQMLQARLLRDNTSFHSIDFETDYLCLEFSVPNVCSTQFTRNELVELDQYLNFCDEESKKYILDKIKPVTKFVRDNASCNCVHEFSDLEFLDFWYSFLQ